MAIKYEWTTAAIIEETKDTITIIFNTRGVPFTYAPGQFINVTLLINDEPVTRSYSLSSSPDEDINPSITVKRVTGGVMSNYIIDNISRISKWHIDGPYGNFAPLASTYSCRHVILLAGGSGITPLFSICRSILGRSSHTKVTLIYSSRTAADVIFKKSINNLKERFNDRLNSYHVLSQPTDDTTHVGAGIIGGRLNKLVARKLIKQASGDPLNNVQYFICGPSALMKLHQEVLGAMQVPAKDIYLEWFAPEFTDASVSLPDAPQEVLLHYYEQSNLLEVYPGKTILEAALADRIPLKYSCKNGTCGVCLGKLIAGKVHMANNFALQEELIEQGFILLCQSHPLNNEVTVEIDNFI